jgi:hypothetical protein
MVKYCTKCGKQNDDQAVFCSACGQRFQEESAPSTVQQSASVELFPQLGTLLTVERGPGAHEHLITDVYLKDASGKLLLVAKKPSLLHGDYVIVDGNDSPVGFLKSSRHLTHSSMSLEDSNHNLQAVIQHSNIETSTQVGPYRHRNPPKCWIEDAKGNKVGSIVFTNGLLGFSCVKQDGSKVFDASVTSGAGLRQELSAMEHRTYAVTLFDNGFPMTTLFAINVVVENLA